MDGVEDVRINVPMSCCNENLALYRQLVLLPFLLLNYLLLFLVHISNSSPLLRLLDVAINFSVFTTHPVTNVLAVHFLVVLLINTFQFFLT